MSENLFRKGLVVRQRQSTRITPRVGNFQQLKITHQMLIEKRLPIKLLQHVKNNIRLNALDRLAQRIEIAVKTHGVHLVPHLLERGLDVILHFPRMNLFIREPFD